MDAGLSGLLHALTCARSSKADRLLVGERATSLSLPSEDATDRIGQTLGEVVFEVVIKSGIRRIAIAGGDSAGRIQKQLQVKALQVAASLDDPAPLCYVYSTIPRIHGLEIAFKGGQVGEENYFQVLYSRKTVEFSESALGMICSASYYISVLDKTKKRKKTLDYVVCITYNVLFKRSLHT